MHYQFWGVHSPNLHYALCDTAQTTLPPAFCVLRYKTLSHAPDREVGNNFSYGRGEEQYEKVYWRWVMTNFPNSFKSWKQFDTLKSTMRALRKHGVWNIFEDWMGANADYLNPPYIQETSIINFQALTQALLFTSGITIA